MKKYRTYSKMTAEQAAATYDWKVLGRVILQEKDVAEFAKYIRTTEHVRVSRIHRFGNRVIIERRIK